MNKYASIVIVVTSTAFAAVWMLADSPERSVDVRTILANDEKVKERLTSYRCFKATLDSSIEALRKGELSLREAHVTVYHSAQQFNPGFLDRLTMAETGKTEAARLAQNLVGHVRSIESVRCSVPSPLPKLESELREMLADPDN